MLNRPYLSGQGEVVLLQVILLRAAINPNCICISPCSEEIVCEIFDHESEEGQFRDSDDLNYFPLKVRNKKATFLFVFLVFVEAKSRDFGPILQRMPYPSTSSIYKKVGTW
ncbi:hypothetical protein ACJX0J_032203 [Zea mays]